MGQFNDVKKLTNEMKVEIKHLSIENVNQKKEISLLKHQLNIIKQDSLNKTLIYFGLNYHQNENVL